MPFDAVRTAPAAVLDHRSLVALAAGAMLAVGAIVRMLAEEQLLTVQYPDYQAYMARTARVIPFVV